MALPSPATGDIVAATDITGIKDHLEGANTAPWLLKSAAGSDLILRAASGRSLRFQDSAAADILVLTGGQGISPSGLILPASAAPAQTVDGEVKWDSVNKWFTVGDGTSRKTFKPAGAGGPSGTLELVGSNTAEVTTATGATVDLVVITLTRAVLVSEVLRIVVSYRKTSGAASVAQLGLKLNTTTVLAPGSSVLAQTTSVNQAEDGIVIVDISPRSTNYQGGFMGSYRTVISASGGAAQAMTASATGLTVLPIASLTSVTITGSSVSASQTLGIKEVKVYAY